MNIFFVYNDELYTAPLESGTILPGVTRESVIQIASDFGYTVRQKSLSMDDIIVGAREGSLQECFGGLVRLQRL